VGGWVGGGGGRSFILGDLINNVRLHRPLYSTDQRLSIGSATKRGLWRHEHWCTHSPSLRMRSIQCIKLTIPYSLNQIPPFILRDANVTSVKHTGLVSCIHWSEIFVSLALLPVHSLRIAQQNKETDPSRRNFRGTRTDPRQILNRQTFNALPRCWTYSFTSLLGRFYAASALNVWRFNISGLGGLRETI